MNRELTDTKIEIIVKGDIKDPQIVNKSFQPNIFL